MNNCGRRLVGAIMAASLGLCAFSYPAFGEGTELTSEQDNAIAMLNHITVLTQDINASKNSRVYMEEAYSSLINNTYPNAVDSRTLGQLTGLLDTMENYRMIGVKRDRLQLIYEQSQAQAIRAAIPNPLGLISTVHSFDPVKLVASIAYMAVDSYTSYTAYTAEAEQKYLKDGWALDDDEANVLHESRKGTFSYMVQMVNDYDLPGDLTLTEDTVDEFVSWKNNDNIVSRIQFLESNKGTYQSYGGYWLALADSYYSDGDYQKCLDAIETYEGMGTRIFRRDYELAKVLPLAIAAAKETYDSDEYAQYAAEHAQTIINNTDHEDWALRYFAAQTLVDLYAETKDDGYVQQAYKIVLDNVNYLVAEQQTMNDTYLAPVVQEKAPKDADKEEKKQIENYNKMLKETRKTEMPPIYEPLRLNCDLLFALADEIDLSDEEKGKIDRMLHPNNEKLFLTEGLDNLYWFEANTGESEEAPIECDFGGNVMILPTALLTNEAVITVTIDEPGEGELIVIDDWAIDKTARETDEDLSTFETAFTSKMSRDYSWKPDSTVSIDVMAMKDSDLNYHFEYRTEGTKKEWYDYLKVWEGHKNNWYDYAKVWENSVTFERVE